MSKAKAGKNIDRVARILLSSVALRTRLQGRRASAESSLSLLLVGINYFFVFFSF